MDDPAKVLFSRRAFGVKPGLDAIRGLLGRLGNPQDAFRVVHVAGTDGKGSVCAMVHSMLCSCGVRAGLYTSPHLVRFAERIKIGNREIDDEALGGLVEEAEKAAFDLAASGGPQATFFEMATAMAALYFARQGVPLVVAEVGLGGRLDATNVLVPAVCAITRIGLEHTQLLGDTIGKIALEKGGIAKRGVPLVIGAMPEEASAAIMQHAAQVGASVLSAPECVHIRRTGGTLASQRLEIESAECSYGRVEMALAASYQVENAATAVAVFETLCRALGVTVGIEAVKNGLAAATLRARFQLLCDDPPLLLDGAHNPCAARALAKALRDAGAGRGTRLVCGMCDDKDCAGFMREIAPVVGKAWTVPLSTPRGIPAPTLANHVRSAGISRVESAASIAEAIEAAKADAAEAGRPVVIAGSLYLAGEVLAAAQNREPDPGELLRSDSATT